MIIGISGKAGVGKDLVGQIIQYLIDSNKFQYRESLKNFNDYIKNNHHLKSSWKIVKWAGKLKDIICILIGCNHDDLEDREFKNTELGEEWKCYQHVIEKTLITVNEFKRLNDLQFKSMNHSFKLISLTPRKLLQLLGTDCGRHIIHPDIWVNALMNEYQPRKLTVQEQFAFDGELNLYPNWIITDTRFPNEVSAIKEKNGIVIRVNRKSIDDMEKLNSIKHESETALDNYLYFDYTINNDGSIEELIKQVKEILIKENII